MNLGASCLSGSLVAFHCTSLQHFRYDWYFDFIVLKLLLDSTKSLKGYLR